MREQFFDVEQKRLWIKSGRGFPVDLTE